MRRWLPFGSAALLAGFACLTAACGEDSDAPVATSTTSDGGGTTAPICDAGERLHDDGSCVAPGLDPEAPCPPGTALDGDACVEPGILPGDCAEGFVHDGVDGCDPVLPRDDCDEGQMAVPGDEACRPIVDCGEAPWGHIAVDDTTVFVDGSYAGTDSDGTAERPFTSIQVAVDAAESGAIVAITDGTYDERVHVENKSVVLWGRCPERVTINGPDGRVAAVRIFPGAAGTVVRSVALTGQEAGVLATGSEDIECDQVWIHDTELPGLVLQDTKGATSGTLRRSLIERAKGFGACGLGADITVEESVIRSTVEDPDRDGQGVYVGPSSSISERPLLTMTRSVISANRTDGIILSGADATIEASVIRDTVASHRSYGIHLEWSFMADPSTASVTGSVIEGISDIGLFAEASKLDLLRTVVRDPGEAEGARRGLDAMSSLLGEPRSEVTIDQSVFSGLELGLLVTGALVMSRTVIRDNELRGLSVQSNDAVDWGSTFDLSSSVFRDNREMALQLVGTQATVRDTVIRDTQVMPAGDGGRGIQLATHDEFLTPCHLDASGLLVERCHEGAVVVFSSALTLSQSEIRDILPSSAIGGRGIQAQRAEYDLDTASTITIQSSVLENLHEAGVMLVGADAFIYDSWIRDISANDSHIFGDGVAVVALDGQQTSAEVGNSRIENSERAGMTNFGGTLRLQGTWLVCQAFDLHAEPWAGLSPVLEDLGQNRCGCPAPDGECMAVSVHLEPPGAL